MQPIVKILYTLFAFLSTFSFANSTQAEEPSVTELGHHDSRVAQVIEIASFEIADEISFDQFALLDRAVEIEHVAKQPGFVSRETAMGDDNEWLVVVYWESLKAADASMDSFSGASAAANFMGAIKTETMSMKRYKINRREGT